MSKKAKETIMKTLMVITLIFGCFFIVIPLLSAVIYGGDVAFEHSVNPLYDLWIIDIILAGIFGLTFLVLLPIFGLPTQEAQAEKRELQEDNIDSLINKIEKSMYKMSYSPQPPRFFDSNGSLMMYVKPSGFQQINCISIVINNELNDNSIYLANDAITESLQSYFNTKRIDYSIDMIAILVVDHTTPDFLSLMNQNPQQDIKRGMLPVGIAFDEKAIYIPTQKDGFAIWKYKKLRELFLTIME